MTRILGTSRSQRISGQLASTYVDRLALVAQGLGREVPALTRPTSESLSDAVASLVDAADRSQVWLTLAALSGRLPTESTVVETARAAEFDPHALFAAVVDETTPESATWEIRLVTSQVVLDVAHTASTTLMTGIQRVVRESARRWLRWHGGLPVSWSRRMDAIRDLTPVELDRILRAAAANEDVESTEVPTVVLPWETTFTVPELAVDSPRTSRIQALAKYARCAVSAVAYDLIPVTSGETTTPGMGDAFARNLSALRHVTRIAPISHAAAVEYEGWRMMLAATGIVGPDIRAVVLPVEAAESTVAEVEEARLRFTIGSLPMVLVVGSHEPRKNHLAVLHAAEMLWREGLEFSLTFVGGNSWNSQGFEQRLEELKLSGRAVEAASKVPDTQLWAAYRLARFTVFPSLNEGFGLPVAESLAVGTPAITSNFGSMAEIAADGGALVVDPHDDESISSAMRTLLLDDNAHAALRAAATARPQRTWDDYATELWDFLIEGKPQDDEARPEHR